MKRRMFSILVVMLVAFTLIGCQLSASEETNTAMNNTEDEDDMGYRVMFQSEKLEALGKIDGSDISFVTFGYRDKDSKNRFYWVDFVANKIQKDEQWYKVNEEKMKSLQDFVCQYNLVLFAGTYAPPVDQESPDMLSLFSYSVNVKYPSEREDQSVDYAVEGFEDYGYPKDWDSLVNKVEQTIQDAEMVQ